MGYAPSVGTNSGIERAGEDRDAPDIDRVEVAAYSVPTDQQEADGTASWDSTTMVCATVGAGGCSGWGWTYAPAACASLISGLFEGSLLGHSAWTIPAAHERMRVAARNAGTLGPSAYALSAVDVALWDLKARLAGMRLVDLLGVARAEVPVYGSGGFTTYDASTLTEQLEGWMAQGIDSVKIKIGEDWGHRAGRDLERVEQVRRVVGPDREVMVDANGGYRRKQAVRVGRALESLGVTWFEEPVSSDDKAGLAELRATLDLDITAGEYANDVYEARRLCEVVDCLQIDATRCGGISGWLRAAAVAASYGLDVSAHCAPHLHVLTGAAVPNMRHIEWFHDHVRIEERYLDGCAGVSEGVLTPGTGSTGHGYELKTRDLERYRVA